MFASCTLIKTIPCSEHPFEKTHTSSSPAKIDGHRPRLKERLMEVNDLFTATYISNIYLLSRSPHRNIYLNIFNQLHSRFKDSTRNEHANRENTTKTNNKQNCKRAGALYLVRLDELYDKKFPNRRAPARHYK
jgi:hypothetical protein